MFEFLHSFRAVREDGDVTKDFSDLTIYRQKHDGEEGFVCIYLFYVCIKFSERQVYCISCV